MDALCLVALRHFQADDFLPGGVTSNPSRFRSCLVIDRDIVNNRGGCIINGRTYASI